MQDRIPTHAGRVKLTPVSGDLYDMEMADEPTVAGTAWSKANVLTDATAQKFVDNAISTTAPTTPNEAFDALADNYSTVFLKNAYTSKEALQKSLASITNINYMPDASASVGNYALFAGGAINNSTYQNTVTAINASKTATNPTGLSVARNQVGGASVGNYALFVGGNNGTRSKVVDAYDTSLTRSLPTQLSEISNYWSGATVGNYAVFVRGSIANAYDTSLTRSIATSPSSGRYLLASASVGDYALFTSGGDVSGSEVVDAYDTSLTYSNPTALSVTRSRAGGASVGNYALFGGGYDGSAVSDAVDAYNTALTRSTPTALSAARSWAGGASIDNYALLAGAQTNTGSSSVVDAYDTSLTRTTPDALAVSTKINAPECGARAGNNAVFTPYRTSADWYDGTPMYKLQMKIPVLSKYDINGITTGETLALSEVDIDTQGYSPYNGYIKRGFTLSGLIS